MWRAETPLGQFPNRGWTDPKVVLKANIFEASHTYALRGQGRFLTAVEAQANKRRYFKAFVADSLDGTWMPLAASRVYRAKFREAMREAGLLDEIDSKVWKQNWVVDVEAVGDGRATLKYLAPYVYRAAISNNRIVAVDESSVTYKVKPTGQACYRTRRVSGHEFVRGRISIPDDGSHLVQSLSPTTTRNQHNLPSSFVLRLVRQKAKS